MTRNGWSFNTKQKVVREDNLCQILYVGHLYNEGGGATLRNNSNTLYIRAQQGDRVIDAVCLIALSRAQLMRDIRALIPVS